MSTPETCWGYAEHDEAERISGRCASRDEAIVEAFTEHVDLGEMWIYSGAEVDPFTLVPHATEIVELMGERASDNCGEVAEDWPDVSDEAKKELNDLLAAWVRKNAPARFWMADGKPERVTRNDLTNARMALGICDERGVDNAAVITSAQLTEAARIGAEIDDASCSTGRRRS
jgi:hypothetical protein